MAYTIERDTPEERAARPRMTFAKFCEIYPQYTLEEASQFAPDDPYLFGFLTRTLVPNARGFFVTAENPRWCSPGEWHRLYYEVRKAASPNLFADE